jgi:hypothetical protein
MNARHRWRDVCTSGLHDDAQSARYSGDNLLDLDLDIARDDVVREVPAAIAVLHGPTLTYAHAIRAVAQSKLVDHQ